MLYELLFLFLLCTKNLTNGQAIVFGEAEEETTTPLPSNDDSVQTRLGGGSGLLANQLGNYLNK